VGKIVLDFDAEGRFIGIEVLGARKAFPTSFWTRLTACRSRLGECSGMTLEPPMVYDVCTG
jgi:Protein of unknown function (DUF2283)